LGNKTLAMAVWTWVLGALVAAAAWLGLLLW
jgi:hypothetical protein